MTALSSALWVASSISWLMALRCSAVAGFTLDRISRSASSTPRLEPMGLNACAKLRRRVALCSGPMDITKGLALVSRMDRPAARVNSAVRNTE